MIYKLIVKRDKNDSGYGDSNFVLEKEHIIVCEVITEYKEKFSSFVYKEYGVYFGNYSLDKLIEGEIVEESIYQFELIEVDYIEF